MQFVTLIWICFGFASISAYAQGPNSLAKCENPDINTVDAFGPKTANDARQFLIKLQDAVRSNNRELVALMIHYPLLVANEKTRLKIKSKDEFLKRYDFVWNPQVKRALMSQSVACLSYASSGFTPDEGSQVGFVIGTHGEIWFTTIDETDTMKIITINN